MIVVDFLTGKRPIDAKEIPVGPEQDWTGKLGSWMGSSKSFLFAIAAKVLLSVQEMRPWMIPNIRIVRWNKHPNEVSRKRSGVQERGL